MSQNVLSFKSLYLYLHQQTKSNTMKKQEILNTQTEVYLNEWIDSNLMAIEIFSELGTIYLTVGSEQGDYFEIESAIEEDETPIQLTELKLTDKINSRLYEFVAERYSLAVEFYNEADNQ